MQNIYAIFDSKAEAYLQPFFSPTKAVALRSFARAAQDSSTDFHRFAADYTLFELGTWDEITGTLTPHVAHQPLGCALEYINAKTEAQLQIA